MRKFIMILLALTASTAGAGGIAVTNGYRMFAMAGFTVQYAPELTLNKASESSFDISNQKLVQKKERISKISFTVTRVPGKELSELKAELQKTFPGKNIREIAQPGARGFYWEERSSESLFGHYDLLTSNGDLIDIKLEAFAAGDGIRWVAPIVHSLVYDSSAPILNEIRFESRTWQAGQKQKFYLHISDDYSGVKPEFFFSYEAADRKPENRFERAYYSVEAELQPEENGWYSVELPLSEYVPNRKFRIGSLSLSDVAGNQRRYQAGENDDHYTSTPAAPGKRIPTARMRVVNHGAEDATPPQVVGFRPDSSVWDVGSTHRVFFKIVDDVSGVSLESRQIGISQPCSLFKVNDETICNGKQSGEFARYRSEGSDWYSVEYTVRDYLPSGEYRINAIVTNDKAGNLRMSRFKDADVTEPGLVSSFILKINNPGPADTNAPKFLDWKVDSTNWKAGEKGKVFFRVTDDVSGVSLENMGIIFKRADGAATATVQNEWRSTRPEGEGWYSLLVPVDQFLQAGTYYPSFVMMQDEAANETNVDCEPNGSCAVRGGDAISLPPLHVEVTR